MPPPIPTSLARTPQPHARRLAEPDGERRRASADDEPAPAMKQRACPLWYPRLFTAEARAGSGTLRSIMRRPNGATTCTPSAAVDAIHCRTVSRPLSANRVRRSLAQVGRQHFVHTSTHPGHPKSATACNLHPNRSSRAKTCTQSPVWAISYVYEVLTPMSAWGVCPASCRVPVQQPRPGQCLYRPFRSTMAGVCTSQTRRVLECPNYLDDT